MGWIKRPGVRVLLALAFIVGASAEKPATLPTPRPTLVITYYTSSANWTAFRNQSRKTLLTGLRRLAGRGVLKHYRVLVNRNLDVASWNTMVVMEFVSQKAVAQWYVSDLSRSAGLTQAGLELTSRIHIVPASLVREGASVSPADHPVFLAIPYRYLVSRSDYVAYLDGYTIPQLDGWMERGILARYSILLDRYPAGRQWNAMLLLEYRGDTALARRDQVKQQVRAQLANDPRWSKIAAGKANVRAELVLTEAVEMAGQ